MICAKAHSRVAPAPLLIGAALVSMWVGSISGCGAATLSFKPGVQGEAMLIDERACHAATDSDEAYRGCMADRGYMIVDGEDVRTSQSGRSGE